MNFKKILRTPTTTNILTGILILVTLLSAIATFKIVIITKDLEIIRQKELINSKIEFVDKLIAELQQNAEYLNKTYVLLDGYKNNTMGPMDIFPIIRLESSSEYIDNKELINGLDQNLMTLKLIKEDINGLRYFGSIEDMGRKDLMINVLKQNIIALFYNPLTIFNLIEKLENYKEKLNSDKIKLEKDKDIN